MTQTQARSFWLVVGVWCLAHSALASPSDDLKKHTLALRDDATQPRALETVDNPEVIQSDADFVRRAQLLGAYLSWVNARLVDLACQTEWTLHRETQAKQLARARKCAPRLRTLASKAQGTEQLLLLDLAERIESYEVAPTWPSPSRRADLWGGGSNAIIGGTMHHVRDDFGVRMGDPKLQRIGSAGGEVAWTLERPEMVRATAISKLTEALHMPVARADEGAVDEKVLGDLGKKLLQQDDAAVNNIVYGLTLPEWDATKQAIVDAARSAPPDENRAIMDKLNRHSSKIDHSKFKPSPSDELRSLLKRIGGDLKAVGDGVARQPATPASGEK